MQYPFLYSICPFLLPDTVNLAIIVILFVSASAKFGICTVVDLNRTFVEDECEHFSFNKCPI
jgi:hypothetical protein